MNKAERWSAVRCREHGGPKGNRDALDRAKLQLGPLNCEHNEQLLSLCPCNSCVETSIAKIATEFNVRNLLVEGAPRRKTVADNINRALDAVRTLSDALVALDDYSRGILVELDELERTRPVVNLYRNASAGCLPTADTVSAPASDGEWVQKLDALARYLNWRVSRFSNPEKGGGSSDKGGKTNLIREMYGPPAHYLVWNCWVVFENCRPGEPTASEANPFLSFVNAVHEFATGNTEENSTLQNWIKKLARPLRHHDLLLKQLGPLESELEELKLEDPNPDRLARILALETELPSLRRKVVDAFLELSHRSVATKSRKSTAAKNSE
jgi:hypothetical protein